MRAAITSSMRVALWAFAMGMSGVTLAWGQCPASPSYSPDFSSKNCLSLNGVNTNSPQYTGSPSFQPPVTPQSSVANVLRLTKNQDGWATSAWYTTPQPVANGFSTTFSFQIGSSSAGGATPDADGIAFVIQNSNPNALGPGGCGMGFGDSDSGCAPATGGISNSVAIAFNTFNNGTFTVNGQPFKVDPSNSDVAIQSCGIGPNSVDASDPSGFTTCSLAINDLTKLSPAILLASNTLHVATVTYIPSTLTNCGTGGTQTCSTLDVVLDGVDLFPGGVFFDLHSIGLAGSDAWVGFTAATGGSNDDQDIVSWTFTPQGQSQSRTITQGQTTTFNINGGFDEKNQNSGYNFTATETTTSQQLQMVVTAIPIDQTDCNTLVGKTFHGAECFVYTNGRGPGMDSSVLFEVTCPPNGSCGTPQNAFMADLGSQTHFDCAENSPLVCSNSSPILTTLTNTPPEVGFLKGEGPDASHPCTPLADGSLFQSNQVESFVLGDVSGSIKGGSGGTTSCWVMTYLTPNELPSVAFTQPVNGANYPQGSTTNANYMCNAVNAGIASPVGPYLAVASCTGTVNNGSPFDTSTPGPHTFSVTVTDSATNTVQQSVTYNVVAAPTISAGGSSATFTLGTRGTVSITTTGFPVPTISESGALPSGVTFVDNHNGTATLSGIPTTMGIYHISFTAQNGVGSAATLPFTLTVESSVPASGTKCNGVYYGTFNGNITVSSGQSCTFVSGGVTGNITETGGNLALANATVGGNIAISGGTYSIGPATVLKGNLTITVATASAVQNQVCGMSIAGALTFSNNLAPVAIGSSSAACPGNIVAGNLTVSGNLAASAIYNNTVGGNLTDQLNSGTTQVFNNHVKFNLVCSSDSSITGGGNTAAKKTGQCASF